MLQARLESGSSELRVNLAAFSRQTEPDTLRLHRSNPLIAQVLSGKQEPFRLERLDTKKKTYIAVSPFKMLQARLELAPRENPDWILSPTRLPIPPLEHIIFNFHCRMPDL